MWGGGGGVGGLNFPLPVLPVLTPSVCGSRLFSKNIIKIVSQYSRLLPPWESCWHFPHSLLPPPVDFPPLYSWVTPPPPPGNSNMFLLKKDALHLILQYSFYSLVSTILFFLSFFFPCHSFLLTARGKCYMIRLLISTYKFSWLVSMYFLN